MATNFLFLLPTHTNTNALTVVLMIKTQLEELLHSKRSWTQVIISTKFLAITGKHSINKLFGIALLFSGLWACTSTPEKGMDNDSKEVLESQVTLEDIDRTTFESLMNQDSVVILDVRTLAEVNAGAIEGAMHLDFYQSDFESKLNLLDKDFTYLLYCRSGNRSSQASALMVEQLDFKNVKNLIGGYQLWANQ